MSTLNTLLSRPLVRFHRPWRGLSDSLLDAELRAGLVTALVLGLVTALVFSTKPQVTKLRFPCGCRDPIRFSYRSSFISSLTLFCAMPLVGTRLYTACTCRDTSSFSSVVRPMLSRLCLRGLASLQPMFVCGLLHVSSALWPCWSADAAIRAGLRAKRQEGRPVVPTFVDHSTE